MEGTAQEHGATRGRYAMDEEIRLSGADHPHVQIPRLGELDAVWARRIVLAAMNREWIVFKRRYEHMAEFADMVAQHGQTDAA